MKTNSLMHEDSDTGAIIICALRYCVGRRTYMPSLVVDWTKRHWSHLSINDQNVIRCDIEQAIQEQDLGDDCDVETWHGFYEWMKDK